MSNLNPCMACGAVHFLRLFYWSEADDAEAVLSSSLIPV
ncbi:ferredoxin [Escherichia coli]|nr:ferredoxin [Escherichia coli]